MIPMGVKEFVFWVAMLATVILGAATCRGQGPTLLDQLREQRRIDNDRARSNAVEDAVENARGLYNERVIRETLERYDRLSQSAPVREWRVGREKFAAKFIEVKPGETYQAGRLVGGKYVQWVKSVPPMVILERDGEIVGYTMGKLSTADRAWLRREQRNLNRRPVVAMRP